MPLTDMGRGRGGEMPLSVKRRESCCRRLKRDKGENSACF